MELNVTLNSRNEEYADAIEETDHRFEEDDSGLNEEIGSEFNTFFHIQEVIKEQEKFDKRFGDECYKRFKQIGYTADFGDKNNIFKLIESNLYHQLSIIKIHGHYDSAKSLYVSPFKSVKEMILILKHQYIQCIRSYGDSIEVDDLKYLDSLMFGLIDSEADSFVYATTPLITYYANSVEELLNSTKYTTLECSINLVSDKMKEIISQGTKTLGYEFDYTIVYNIIDWYFNIISDIVKLFKSCLEDFVKELNG